MPSSTPKIALVTGANKGIGLETSRQLAKLSFVVLMAARDESRGQTAAAQVAKEGGQVQFLKLDAVNPADRAAVATGGMVSTIPTFSLAGSSPMTCLFSS